jgi:hypothetical protein
MATIAHISESLKEAIKADPTIVTDYIHPHSLNVGVPTEKILPPKVGGEFPVDETVIAGRIPNVEQCTCQLPVYPMIDDQSLANSRHEAQGCLSLWLISVGSGGQTHHRIA